jgi:hypothetical protein
MPTGNFRGLIDMTSLHRDPFDFSSLENPPNRPVGLFQQKTKQKSKLNLGGAQKRVADPSTFENAYAQVRANWGLLTSNGYFPSCPHPLGPSQPIAREPGRAPPPVAPFRLARVSAPTCDLRVDTCTASRRCWSLTNRCWPGRQPSGSRSRKNRPAASCYYGLLGSAVRADNIARAREVPVRRSTAAAHSSLVDALPSTA